MVQKVIRNSKNCVHVVYERPPKAKSRDKDAVKIRELSRNFALEAIGVQRNEFVSWGVMADWSKPYLTMEKDFVKAQIRLFHDLLKKGYIYQRFMPVYWSPSTRTALAESELEYNQNHISTAVYIRFPIEPKSLPDSWSNWNVYALSWTTTPWSLAANKAISYRPDTKYCLVQGQNAEKYILAEDLLKSNPELGDIFDSIEVISSFKGEEIFPNLTYFHPLDSKSGAKKFFPGSHVNLDSGTGLVHTAPSHGQEDYLLGLEFNLDLSCCVNELGKYDETVFDKRLQNLPVLTDGNEKILELLHDQNHILKQTKYQHSYPYDWRSKKPVILRGSKQWFIDTGSLQKKALEILRNDIKMNSNQGFEKVLQSRPYWCISRQRVWGVPIPVFYNENNEAVIDEQIVDKICDKVEMEGNVDFWWSLSEKELLGEEKSKNLSKGKDILDVWFDSGITWNSVLPQKKADLYLEGLDQFSGWFYSSLLTSVAAQNCSPYKKIFVHGFALDEKGRKMSKSLGNVIAPSQITKSKGVDVLRFWVAAHGNSSSSIQVSENLMSNCKQEFERFRNVLKFMLGNLSNFEKPEENLKKVDLFTLHLLAKYFEQIVQNYENFNYNKVILNTLNFVANDLSGFYLSLIKDRLYCEAENSKNRKSALTTLFWITQILTKSLGPILPVLAEEINEIIKVEMTQIDANYKNWINEDLAQEFQHVLQIRKTLNSNIEINKSKILVKLPGKNLNFSQQDLAEILQVPQVELVQEDCEMEILPTSKYLCPRCRIHQSDEPDNLCQRCEKVVMSLK